VGNGETPQGEDKGEGEINTLPIAGCRLSIGKTKTRFLLEFTLDLFRCRNDKRAREQDSL